MTVSEWLTAGGVLVAILTAFAALVTAFAQRRQAVNARANTVTTATSAAIDSVAVLLGPLNARIEQLTLADQNKSARLEQLERELADERKLNQDYREGIDRLIHQIRSYRQEPVWYPGKPKTGPLADVARK